MPTIRFIIAIDGHSVSLSEQNIKDSKLVFDMIDDGDTDVAVVPMVTCNYQQVKNAVDALTLARLFVYAVYDFDYPAKHTSFICLRILKQRIIHLYTRWQKLVSDNKVYKWLDPVDEIEECVHKYETKENIAGWFRDNDIYWSRTEQFIESCKNGNETVAKWFYRMDVDSYTYNDAFRAACANGHEVIAKWLYGLGGVNIHRRQEFAFRGACAYGHESIAKWLYGLGGVNIHAYNDDAFRTTCSYGHLSIAKWLYGLDRIDIHAYNDHAFRMACKYGHEDIAKWLYGLGGVNTHKYNDYAFRMACKYGHENIAKWLKFLD
jgi:hypothetical protein